MAIQAGVCAYRHCKHYIGVQNNSEIEFGEWTEAGEFVNCNAFPDGIPGKIFCGRNPHTEPYPGDHGIQYESDGNRMSKYDWKALEPYANCLRKDFIEYLEKHGYASMTKSGRPSTVYDYSKRIDRICEREKMNWLSLAHKIDAVISRYDTGGAKELYGKQSHRAPINALKQFAEFLNSPYEYE